MTQENIEYISKLLPDSGWICVAQLLKGGGFKHYWYQSIEEAVARLEGLDNKGYNAYLAQATFKTDESRKQENAEALQSCFFDIDCGPGKDFASQREGAEALMKFCKDTNLPIPSVLSSGNGLYSHWHFQDSVPAGLWKNTAQMLKQLTHQFEFKVDQSRTADSSSVLRPPGVRNWKDPENPKPVRILSEAPFIHHNDFHNLLVKALGIRALPVRTSHKQDNEFAAIVDGPPSDPEKIADKCLQMNAMRTTGGDMPEPLWYAMLCILRHCEGGREKAHEWSSGHTGYSPEETERKLNQSDTGPSLCLYIASHNPEGCVSCRFQSKIRSPITLGKPEPKELVRADNTYPEPPAGYRISEEGVFRRVESEWEMIYKYPVYVDSLVADAALGHEVAVIRHRDPHGLWQEVGIRSALIHDKKQMLMCLHDQHLQAPTGETEKLFMYYITNAIQKMRETAPIQAASHQMGWKEPLVVGQPYSFVLGDEVHAIDGSTMQFSFSKTVPDIVRAFFARGEAEAWSKETRILGEPGYEPQAFALLAGAFGAPLMRWTGFQGALVSMIGQSGVGKTLIGSMILSAYGDPARLMLLRDDTRNAMIARLGVYGSLPCYVDEVSNMPGDELSDFAYRITQGRDKARLTKVSIEKSNINSWNTIAIASSNHSIVERLAVYKADASAEYNRILEYPVNQEFTRETATRMYRAIHENHGAVGRVYAKYLVEHQTELKEKLDLLSADIDKMTNAPNEERFWSATLACALYGGAIAKKLGLVEFDVAKLIPWMTQTVFNMRSNKQDSRIDMMAVLSSIMDKHAGSTIVVEEWVKGKMVNPLTNVHGNISARLEVKKGHYWISKDTLKQELQKRYVSWAQFKKDLAHIILSTGAQMTLGRGTWYSTSQQQCVQIQLLDTLLGDKIHSITEKEEFEA